jgi:hypothetical protein
MNEPKKAIDIASETRRLFPPGCRVERRDDKKPRKIGVVEGYSMGGFAIHGVDALSCLNIRFDKTLSKLHRDFVRLVSAQ